MLGLLILLFTVIPALELYLLFQVGGQIGGMNTILIIILTGVVGASLAKSQGLQILMKIQSQAQRMELPGDQIIQGLMVFAGGLLLLTPGFMTDILGFSLVIPGPRHLLMGLVKKALKKSFESGNINFYSFGNNSGGTNSGFYSYSSYEYTDPGKKVDDNVVEVEFREKNEKNF